MEIDVIKSRPSKNASSTMTRIFGIILPKIHLDNAGPLTFLSCHWLPWWWWRCLRGNGGDIYHFLFHSSGCVIRKRCLFAKSELEQHRLKSVSSKAPINNSFKKAERSESNDYPKGARRLMKNICRSCPSGSGCTTKAKATTRLL